MIATDQNIKMIEIVAKGLGDLLDKFVFVGGSIVGLYIDEFESTDIRPTEDVDCIINLAKQKDYFNLEKQLRSRGFKNQIQQKRSLICRWEYSGITVDIMPDDPDILGFSNKWYKQAIESADTIKLSNKLNIKILSLPFFIVTKLDAFESRGLNDFRTSSDIEDIINVTLGKSNFASSLNKAPIEVKSHLKKFFKQAMNNKNFIESIKGNFPSDLEKEEKVINNIQEFIKN